MEFIFKTFAFVKKIHPPFFEKLNFFNCLSFLSHYINYFKIKKICIYICRYTFLYKKLKILIENLRLFESEEYAFEKMKEYISRNKR